MNHFTRTAPPREFFSLSEEHEKIRLPTNQELNLLQPNQTNQREELFKNLNLNSRKNSLSFELDFFELSDKETSFVKQQKGDSFGTQKQEQSGSDAEGEMILSKLSCDRFPLGVKGDKGKFEADNHTISDKIVVDQEKKVGMMIEDMPTASKDNKETAKADDAKLQSPKLSYPIIKVNNLKTNKFTNKKIRKKRYDGCSCKNSNCLRLHCACFKELGYCKPTCRCLDCLNSREFEQTRNFAIEKTKFIFSDAFKTINPVYITDDTGEKFKINAKGCNCKTGCARNYCECRKINGRCSYICKCQDCVNGKIALEKDDIQKIYKPNSRKKHKIVINYKKEKKSDNGLIEFQVYNNMK